MTRSTRRTRSSSSKKEEEDESVSEALVAEEDDPPCKKSRSSLKEDLQDRDEESKEKAKDSSPMRSPSRPQDPSVDNGVREENKEESDLKGSSSSPLENDEKDEKDEKDENDHSHAQEEDDKMESEETKEAKESPSSQVVNGSSKEGTEEKKKSPELERFWKAVTTDPMDFSSWTCLLQFADANGDLEEGREAYDAFLDRYPYCYGYWKKYADLEKRKGTPERTMMVFERGIAAICLSGDLWIHYLNHVRTVYEEDFIRTQYERAVGACGLEWRSDKLWDHYVKWEVSLKRYNNVLSLYDRILKNPTQGLTHQFEMFRDFVKEHKPKDILSNAEFLSLRKEVLQSIQDEENNKSEDTVPKEPPPDADSTEEEDIAMKEKIIFSRKRIYKETEEFVQERWKFEDNIKRPYFHMKPLERGQLKNWSEYLDFEIQRLGEKHKSKKRKSSKDEEEGTNEKNTEEDKGEEEGKSSLVNETRVEILFERCLIACALYEEFWFKYIDWLSKRKDGDFTEMIRNIYKKACEHHLREKVDIHLRRAEFEEKNGNLSLASDILSKLESKHPEAIGFSLKHINIERRQGNHDQVRKLFESAIDKSSGSIRSEIAVKYGRYLRLIHGDEGSALNILQDSIPHDEKNPKIYLQILDIYLHAHPPLDLTKITVLLDSAIDKVSAQDAILFSQRKVEFLEDFGADIRELEIAKTKNAQLRKELRSTLEESSSGDKTDEGKKDEDSSSTAVSNSASYNAHHNSQYQQYGARYSSNYNYNGSGYGNYYQAYGGSYAGY